MDNVEKIEHELMSYAMEKISELPYVTVYGPKEVEKEEGNILCNRWSSST